MKTTMLRTPREMVMYDIAVEIYREKLLSDDRSNPDVGMGLGSRMANDMAERRVNELIFERINDFEYLMRAAATVKEINDA